jgi:endonuclease/exonuclease/phosphatase (EEP) superfamily protein YafD
MAAHRAMTRLSKMTVAGVAIGVATLLGGYAIGPERIWLVSLAQYVPYPAYLLPAVISAIVSFTLGWRWRLAAMTSLVLVITVVMGLARAQAESGSGRIRVLTYNVKDYLAVRRDSGLIHIAREVASHNPDVFVLQDARELSDLRRREPETARLLFGDRDIYVSGQYVIASRFPLKECRHGEIPFGGEAHTYATCVVTANGIEFTVISVHFMTPRFGLAATRRNPLAGAAAWTRNVGDRMTQAEKLATDVRAQVRPVIVAGDLNAPALSLAVRVLTAAGLRDAFSAAGRGYGFTWGQSLRTGFSFLRLDHILVGPEFGVADCFVGDARPSAHRPVIADLFVTRD